MRKYVTQHIRSNKLLTQEVKVTLLLGLLEDVLLDRARRHQPVDVHLSRLPDAVGAVLRACVRTRASCMLSEGGRDDSILEEGSQAKQRNERIINRQRQASHAMHAGGKQKNNNTRNKGVNPGRSFCWGHVFSK